VHPTYQLSQYQLEAMTEAAEHHSTAIEVQTSGSSGRITLSDQILHVLL